MQIVIWIVAGLIVLCVVGLLCWLVAVTVLFRFFRSTQREMERDFHHRW